jgi:hypothetical protein
LPTTSAFGTIEAGIVIREMLDRGIADRFSVLPLISWISGLRNSQKFDVGCRRDIVQRTSLEGLPPPKLFGLSLPSSASIIKPTAAG